MSSSPLDNLPSLPSDVTLANAGLWAATVLLLAGTERGWSAAEMRGLLLSLFAVHAVHHASDEQILSELQNMLATIRGSKAAKS